MPIGMVLSAAFRLDEDQSAWREVVSARLGIRYVFPVCSGRAALTVLLNTLKECSDRREVVIPAYSCFSVPSAVARAGLVIRLCDVDPKTLDLDQNALSRLNLSKALCIIPSGLYGMPADLESLGKIAHTCRVFLIDDAAQCLGATMGGKPCGTFGDAGFYSLGRGKNITTMGGGIIVTRKGDLAQLIQEEVKKLRVSSPVDVISCTLNSILYAIMLPPSRYWILDRLPFLGLGDSRFDPSFALAQLSAFQARLAGQVFPLFEKYNRIRQNNAHRLQSGIEGVEGIEVPRPVAGASAVYLRFPILVRDRTHRSRLLKQLRRAGIGASPSYPTAIADIPGIGRHLAENQQPCPGARSIAERIITLPTHPYVTAADVDRIIGIIRESG